MNWKNVLLIFVSLVFAVGLVKTLGNISQGRRRLAEVKDEVTRTAKQKQDIEEEIKQRESLLYLETEARNRLNLIKPGERVVIMPKKPEVAGSSDGSLGSPADDSLPEPNWVKWKRLFFN
jgi:cell division protein FtsB